MYKFFGTPLQEINSSKTERIIFKFDTKGEFITDDPKIIDRAIGRFDHLELKGEPIGKRVGKTFFVPAMTIETKNDKPDENYACKKCDYTTSNKGELMAHYRKNHKEG